MAPKGLTLFSTNRVTVSCVQVTTNWYLCEQETVRASRTTQDTLNIECTGT